MQKATPVENQIKTLAPIQAIDILGGKKTLGTKRYEDYRQLELYCYRVASVVGLLSIEIFGYENPACRDYAIALGKALQLTNILRDVRSDVPMRFTTVENIIAKSVASQRFMLLLVGVFGASIVYTNLAGGHIKSLRRSLANKGSSMFISSIYAGGALGGFMMGSLVANWGWGFAGQIQISLLSLISAIVVFGLRPSEFSK